LHIHVGGTVYNRGQQLLTIVGVFAAKAAGQALEVDGLQDATLEPGGEGKPIYFSLVPDAGVPLAATPGDTLVFKVRATRGGLRAQRVKLTLGLPGR